MKEYYLTTVYKVPTAGVRQYLYTEKLTIDEIEGLLEKGYEVGICPNEITKEKPE